MAYQILDLILCSAARFQSSSHTKFITKFITHKVYHTQSLSHTKFITHKNACLDF